MGILESLKTNTSKAELAKDAINTTQSKMNEFNEICSKEEDIEKGQAELERIFEETTTYIAEKMIEIAINLFYCLLLCG
jgi:hypothetical protein